MLNLPESFQESMQELLSDEYHDYLKSFQEKRLFGLRVNTSKISIADFEKISPFQIRKIPYITNGYFYEGTEEPAKHPYYYAGLYYLQEPSAMLPADCTEIKGHEKILDLCAAPGGKSTELGARLNGSGVLMANDISASRAKALLKNIEIQGISNCYVTAEAPEKLAQFYPETFDIILVDAPCSGEGMFRKDPNLIKSWVEKGPAEYHILQESIVDAAVKMLKPGGKVMYSTCTFSKCEDEETIADSINRNPSMELCDMEQREGFQKGIPPYEKCIRIYPHKLEGEGHFLALLKKKDSLISQSHNSLINKPKLSATELKLMTDFFDAVHSDTLNAMIHQDRLLYKDHSIYLLPDSFSYHSSIRYLRTGLLLGTLENGKRFEPSQAFAMCLKSSEYQYCLNMKADDPFVTKYIKGETIPLPEDWNQSTKAPILVCVDGYPLGWGRQNGFQLKNKYQTGWRMQA